MIIKSLSRKGRKFGAPGQRGARGSMSPFAALTHYMNKVEKAERVKPVLWHNFYGHEKMTEEEIVQEFEANASLLRARANGNVLYHEILSFSSGHRLKDAELERMVADIGEEYLANRAPEQLAYGVIHRDTDHIHLHLMISANRVGRPERVRLSREEFGEAQRKTERFALERFPELAQTRIYDRERPREKLKTQADEQAMRRRTKAPSRKEAMKSELHQLFERAAHADELFKMLKEAGYSYYERGKNKGVVTKEMDGSERRHRFSTLGVEDHYQAAMARWALPEPMERKPVPERGEDAPTSPGEAQSSRSPLRDELQELLQAKEKAKDREGGPKRDGPSRDDER